VAAGLYQAGHPGGPQWAELVSPDDKKRAEIITEFFNMVMTDNAAKAVHDMYRLVYEQVINADYSSR
jgi:hypothetical protein